MHLKMKTSYLICLGLLFLFSATSSVAQSGSLCQHSYTTCLINCQHTFEWCSNHCGELFPCEDEGTQPIQLKPSEKLGITRIQPITRVILSGIYALKPEDIEESKDV